MALIKVHAISKTIGYRQILHKISFVLQPGQLAAVTGSNGAGKSTLLKILAGLLPQSSGRVDGIAFGQVGYVGHQPMVYKALTVEENLVFFAKLHGTFRQDLVPRVLERVHLTSAAKLQSDMLSRGMLQRLALGRLLVQDPTVYLLDEPYTGLDAQGQQWLTTFIADLLAQQRFVVVVSHHLAELDPLSYQEVRLQGGSVV